MIRQQLQLSHGQLKRPDGHEDPCEDLFFPRNPFESRCGSPATGRLPDTSKRWGIGQVRILLLAAVTVATLPGYWTPAQANRVLTAPTAQIASVTTLAGSNHSQVRSITGITKAACRGMGKAKRAGFPAFFCGVQSEAGDVNAYVRVWSSSQVCVSARSLADCPPVQTGPPLPGDPRCGIRSADCMGDAARAATFEILRSSDSLPVEGLGCQAVTAFVYRCTWNSSRSPTQATVRFVQGKKAWTIRTTLG